VGLGFYSSETELVKDAVRHMREEEEKFKHFQAAVRVGDEQIANGETVSYSGDLMTKIEQRAVKKAQQGKKVNNPKVVDVE
jgi:Arc/MetJ-type ribon-helix-helix transcriptional regulator